MKNTDFRRLVQDTPRAQTNGSSAAPFAMPMSLGSRKTSSIPMTPRTVKGGPSVDFARQLAEQNTEPAKKFRSAAVPKGARLGTGYTDRARDREEKQREDDREARINALEEQVKLGQIEREVFEQLRDQITGGDVDATHLVKGLDRKLLERVRNGEDVLSSEPKAAVVEPTSTEAESLPDAEDELEKLEGMEIVPIQRDDVRKKGEMAPPPKPALVASKKRTRNDIIAEWKASRKAEVEAKLAAQLHLGPRFKKLNVKQPQTRIERDGKGREVLITVDEDGRTKRKVRQIFRSDNSGGNQLKVPDKSARVLGMTVPERAPDVEEDDEMDAIFEGVGDSYDPLGLDDSDEGDSSESDSNMPGLEGVSRKPREESKIAKRTEGHEAISLTEGTPTRLVAPAQKNNYFTTEGDAGFEDDDKETSKGLKDRTIIETIRRAAALQRTETLASTELDAPSKSQSTIAQRLFQRDRDLDDIDMGFGSSRFGDEEEGEGVGKVKLSKWKALGNDDGDEGDDGSKSAKKDRKRGGKKHKGDKNSASDVLRVLEARK